MHSEIQAFKLLLAPFAPEGFAVNLGRKPQHELSGKRFLWFLIEFSTKSQINFQ